MGNIVHMPRRRTQRNQGPGTAGGAAAGTAARGGAAEDAPQCKKKSGFWSIAKWVGIGAASAIVGYEGLKYWKRFRGDAPADKALPEPERNAALPSPPMAMGGGTTTVVPIPIMGPSPMYPPYQPYPPVPAAAPEPAPEPSRNDEDDEDDELREAIILAKAREIRKRQKERKAMEAMEGFEDE